MPDAVRPAARVTAINLADSKVPGQFRMALTASNDMIDRALPAFRAAGRQTVHG